MSIQNFVKTDNQLQHFHFFHKQNMLQWLYGQKIPIVLTASKRNITLYKQTQNENQNTKHGFIN